MVSLLYADTPAGQAGTPSPLVSLAPLLVIFAIFYFLVIRPQQKKIKQQKNMVDQLKKGDHVVTSSGFFATVVNIGEDTLEIELAEKVKVKILKSAVTDVRTSSDSQSRVSSSKAETEKIVR